MKYDALKLNRDSVCSWPVFPVDKKKKRNSGWLCAVGTDGMRPVIRRWKLNSRTVYFRCNYASPTTCTVQHGMPT